METLFIFKDRKFEYDKREQKIHVLFPNPKGSTVDVITWISQEEKYNFGSNIFTVEQVFHILKAILVTGTEKTMHVILPTDFFGDHYTLTLKLPSVSSFLPEVTCEINFKRNSVSVVDSLKLGISYLMEKLEQVTKQLEELKVESNISKEKLDKMISDSVTNKICKGCNVMFSENTRNTHRFHPGKVIGINTTYDCNCCSYDKFEYSCCNARATVGTFSACNMSTNTNCEFYKKISKPKQGGFVSYNFTPIAKLTHTFEEINSQNASSGCKLNGSHFETQGK